MPLNKVEELTLVVDGVRVFYRRVRGEGTPTVYVHGNPSNSEDFLPFLMRAGGPGVALDLPGWGRSEHPDADAFSYTMEGLSRIVERFLEELGITQHRLVVHDWGSLALIASQRRPELVERLVIINAVPLLPGYRWHWMGRLWRRRGAGEAVNATTSRAGTALALREAHADRRPMPDELVDSIWRHWDRGTSAAVLSLYRDADPERLAEAGRDLVRLDCPALVVWGRNDRYLPARFGRDYADRLPDASYVEVPGAGHWPWIEDPGVVETVLGFLGDG